MNEGVQCRRAEKTPRFKIGFSPGAENGKPVLRWMPQSHILSGPRARSRNVWTSFTPRFGPNHRGINPLLHKVRELPRGDANRDVRPLTQNAETASENLGRGQAEAGDAAGHVGAILERQTASMVFGDLATEHEADAGTFGLRGEERHE